MDILMIVAIYLVGLLIALGIGYAVIQSAVTSAMRRARREQFVEDFLPEKATWLTEKQRVELRAHADAVGNKSPVK